MEDSSGRSGNPSSVHNFADCINAEGDRPCRDCVEYALESVGAPPDIATTSTNQDRKVT